MVDGIVKLRAPSGASSVARGEFTARVGADGTIAVPVDLAQELSAQGFEVLAPPQMADEALDELRARRDALTARLDGLRAQEADLAADIAEATRRLESAKSALAAEGSSVIGVRAADKRTAELNARALLLAEAVAVVRRELSDVEAQVSGEEDVRDYARQTDAAEPLIAQAAAAVEEFAAALASARDALIERVAVLDRIASECPRVSLPTLSVKQLGLAVQEALAIDSIEGDVLARASFERFALTVLVGPYFRPDSAEATARLDALRVTR